MNLLRSLAGVLLLSTAVLAGDWPGWLGPKRDGTSPETVKPWKGDLPVVWKKAVGAGHSSPAVADGVVYLHARVKGKEEEAVTAYDAKTGKELWTTSYARRFFFSPFGTGPQATPAVAAGKVYSFGATGVLACFDAKKGDLIWKVETEKQFKANPLFFGAGCSPLADNGQVVVNVGGKGASVVAFSPDRGEVLWKSLDDGASYSSPIIADKGGRKQYVFLTANALRGLDPKTGKSLWDVPMAEKKLKVNENSPTPVVAGDLILGSTISIGMVGLKVTGGGDGMKAEEVWRNRRLTCYFSTPIPVGKKHVYMVTGTVAPGFRATSTLHCVETETGKILWSVEKVGKYHAALLKTGDDKMLMLSDLGDLVLFDPNPKEYRELARSKVVKGEQIWAHPALVDGKLYFRDDRELICLQMPQ